MDIFDYKLEVYDLSYRLLADLVDNSDMRAYEITVNKNVNEIDTLTFKINAKSPKVKYLLNEELIKFDGDYYFIKNPKETRNESSVITVECEHISSGLAGIHCGKIEIPAGTPQELITEVLKGTNWEYIGTDAPGDMMRHLISEGEKSVFENLIEIANVFNGTLEFSTREDNTHCVFLRVSPVDRGTIVEYGFNLKSEEIDRDSKEIFTRLTMFGAVDETTGEEINIMGQNPSGSAYVENYSYYTRRGYTIDYIKAHPELFLKECIIRDTSIDDPAELYRLSIEKLEQISKPVLNATIEAADLSLLPEYMLEKPIIGEKIIIYDYDIEMELEAQVVSISKNYDNPLAISFQISNVISYQDRFNNIFQNSDKIDKVFSGSDGKLHGIYIKDLTVDTAKIKDLAVQTAKIDNLAVTSAKIAKAAIGSGHIKDLSVGSAHIQQASIGDAHIIDLSADKLNAGRIDTSKIKVSSRDGEIEISGYQVMVNDTTNLNDIKNRVILGKYKRAENDWCYGLVVRGQDGQTVMIDEAGVHNAGITSGAIDDNKIADDANINGAKIDINSVIRIVNQGEGIETIKGAKIYLDNDTLDVVMSNVQKVQTAHGNSIESNKGQIKVLSDNIKLIVDSLEKVEEGINQNAIYKVEIISTNGYIFKNNNISTTLQARVYKGKNDVTAEFDAAQFRWTRVSDDSEGDRVWNEEHTQGSKSIEVTSKDVKNRATFNVDVHDKV